MKSTLYRSAATVVAALSCLVLAACGGGGGASSGKTELTVLVDNQSTTTKQIDALVKAFEKAHPDIDVKVDSRPQGGDGDNIDQDEAVDRRDGGRLLVQLRLAAAGAQPGGALVDLTDDPVALKDTESRSSRW